MGNLFGSPSLPAVAPPVAPPARSDPEVQDAAARERQRRRALVGRSSTNLTGDEGVLGTAATQRSLLGGRGMAAGS